MLGYVQVDKPELKVREYEIYCGYYCGICKSIGKRYGQLPRMALSYDAAFLAVMLESLSEQPESPTQEHCITHPLLKKKTVIRNSAIDYAGDVMLILAWYKLMDDAHDEGKLYAKGTMALMKRIFKKLRRRYPALCAGIEEHLGELSALEKAKCESLDMAAEAFSRIMEVIFEEGVKAVYGNNSKTDVPDSGNTDYPPSDGTEKPETAGGCTLCIDEMPMTQDPRRALAQIGYHMGKWIYLIDAVDDIEENIESGAYNPLLYRFSYDRSKETALQFRDRIRGDLEFNLYHYLAVISNYANGLDIKKNKGIIENIIYFGLHRKTEEIINRVESDNRL